jgi:hypothetical protein
MSIFKLNLNRYCSTKERAAQKKKIESHQNQVVADTNHTSVVQEKL